MLIPDIVNSANSDFTTLKVCRYNDRRCTSTTM